MVMHEVLNKVDMEVRWTLIVEFETMNDIIFIIFLLVLYDGLHILIIRDIARLVGIYIVSKRDMNLIIDNRS